MQRLCSLCTQLGLEESELLGTELETNTVLKPHFQCNDYAADPPLKVPEFNLHGKGIGPRAGKELSSADTKPMPLLKLPKQKTSPTPQTRHIHDSISGDPDRTDIMSETKRQSF